MLMKKKVLQISNYYSPEIGGIEKVAESISEALREEYEIRVVCFTHEKIGGNKVVGGINVVRCGTQIKIASQAMKMLDDRYVLYIVGKEGKSTKLLKGVAADIERVVFLGEVDSDTLHAYMSSCDIFCFPSVTKNEAFGIALAEGMYYAKPAITFTIPGSGVNYVNVNEETGIEVANRDVKAFANAIKYVAEHDEVRERYGIGAKNRVRKLFLQEHYKNNIKQVIEALI